MDYSMYNRTYNSMYMENTVATPEDEFGFSLCDIIVGPERTMFTVHKAVFARMSFGMYDAMRRGNRFVMADVHAATFIRLHQFAYGGDYGEAKVLVSTYRQQWQVNLRSWCSDKDSGPERDGYDEHGDVRLAYYKQLGGNFVDAIRLSPCQGDPDWVRLTDRADQAPLFGPNLVANAAMYVLARRMGCDTLANLAMYRVANGLSFVLWPAGVRGIRQLLRYVLRAILTAAPQREGLLLVVAQYLACVKYCLRDLFGEALFIGDMDGFPAFRDLVDRLGFHP